MDNTELGAGARNVEARTRISAGLDKLEEWIQNSMGFLKEKCKVLGSWKLQ